MRHHIEEARHNAEATLAEVNRHMKNARAMRNPKVHEMLNRMKADALRAIKDANDELRHAYRGTNTGRHDRGDYHHDRTNDIYDVVNDAVDVIDRILPRLDDIDDADMRRGVPGTGPYSRRRRGGRVRVGGYTRRLPRYDIDDDMDWDDMDYAENQRRRRMPRRDRYGRFTRADYDDYADDDMAMAAATAAAETARRMTNDRGDNRGIYPQTPMPVMPRQDMDNRHDRNDRADDTGDTRNTDRIGPAARRT